VPAHPAEHSVARRLDETMEGASAELVAWVGTQEDFEVFKAPNGKTKVKCTLTDHELLPVLETCKVYLGGKAYKKAKRKRELAAFDFAQFEPHIIAHKTDPHLLFCVRTQVTLMRDVTAVQNYVKSRAYQVAVEHWKKGQAKGKVEIEKLEVGGAGRKKRKGADEEDDDDESGDESEDEDMTAEEFAEMERLTVRMHSILPSTRAAAPLYLRISSMLFRSPCSCCRCVYANRRGERMRRRTAMPMTMRTRASWWTDRRQMTASCWPTWSGRCSAMNQKAMMMLMLRQSWTSLVGQSPSWMERNQRGGSPRKKRLRGKRRLD